jgi:hypothetical protein
MDHDGNHRNWGSAACFYPLHYMYHQCNVICTYIHTIYLAVINCGALATPVRTTKTGNKNTYQSTAKFVCRTGSRRISGTSTRTCQANGKWSGTLLVCVSKYFSLSDEVFVETSSCITDHSDIICRPLWLCRFSTCGETVGFQVTKVNCQLKLLFFWLDLLV